MIPQNPNQKPKINWKRIGYIAGIAFLGTAFFVIGVLYCRNQKGKGNSDSS